MKIVMLTNTFTPHVGGVARSVSAFTNEYRRCGHQVLVVAPEFPDMPKAETGVVRIPAIQNFNGSDFSVVLPVSGLLTDVLDDFKPQIIHAHHPYLLGTTALRIARYRELPLVYTHHTLIEQYTHYMPGDTPGFKRFAIKMGTRYANLADQVFAPSESIVTLLQQRGVQTPITVVPTGVDVEHFAQGDGARFRAQMAIPADAFVVGHLGRLAPEKNLEYLAEAVADFVKQNSRARFLVVGKGPSEPQIRAIFARRGLSERLHIAGILEARQLVDAYHAMDVFAFSSRSETQGMVLTEAMAAGVPVVALDAPGVREVVRDECNGRLILNEPIEALVSALQWIASLPAARRSVLQQCVHETADKYSMPNTAEKALACYESLIDHAGVANAGDLEHWGNLLHLIKAEWDIARGIASATGAALSTKQPADRWPS
ncbi:MAG: glycosyltransferase [Gammaproteobacteria bacterium]|nr:glycosyltransferase [Gammaproteobacteria bacterium]